MAEPMVFLVAAVFVVGAALENTGMEPGSYSFGDDVKVGLPRLLLTMLITVTLMRLTYRF